MNESGTREEETPHPSSSDGHLLPWGEELDSEPTSFY